MIIPFAFLRGWLTTAERPQCSSCLKWSYYRQKNRSGSCPLSLFLKRATKSLFKLLRRKRRGWRLASLMGRPFCRPTSQESSMSLPFTMFLAWKSKCKYVKRISAFGNSIGNITFDGNKAFILEKRPTWTRTIAITSIHTT